MPSAPGSVALPGHGSCYICGTENPAGLGITFRLEAGRVKTDFTLGERQQGPPGHAHGGCLSAVLDEAMGAAVWCAGHPVVAARLEIDFRKAVPLATPCHVEAWVTTVKGRKIWAEAELRLADGALATRGRGLFVEARRLFPGDLFVPRY
jgi:acyl-coenzyme A thioesterase PaaI-like protein